jgi:intracellular multiplication protein IcmE
MSDAAAPGKSAGFTKRVMWSGAGRAGPRRLLIIGVSSLAVVAALVFVTFDGRTKPAVSVVARMQSVDANPGGLSSNQEQNALALSANDTAANSALRKGVSYTPPIAASVPVVDQIPAPPPTAASAAPLPAQHFATPAPAPPPPPAPVQQAVDPVFPPPLPGTPVQQPPVVQVADTGGVSDPQQQQAYSTAINGLISQWNGRPPMTDVVLPPVAAPSNGAGSAPTANSSGSGQSGSDAASPQAPDPDPAASDQQVLIPAGRGIFAHPILALSSDATSPVVLQADSGPIAGDRMIGNFSTEKDRLIINVGEIIHNGQTISCNGVVIAPDTMEAAVASGVHQHYVARFLLPAAAAFVQGLGNALATTSNTATVLSPLGGASSLTQLNFHQQLGVAAGAAAAQVGSTLDQDAPKGPTVTLDANVAVGVMFLTDVKLPGGA